MRQLILATILTLVASTAYGQWGDFKVRFVYGGAAPKAVPAKITKDLTICGKHKLIDESLIVNAENKGILNVVAFLKTTEAPPIHPSYEKLKSEPVAFDNSKCRFEPHIATVWTARKLLLGNKDSVGHNAKFNTISNEGINPLIPAGAMLPVEFAEEERLPAEVSCSIHPWMRGYIVVRNHPYSAVSNADGEIEMKNLPEGKWLIQLWQEKSGYVREGTIDGKDFAYRAGRVEVEITDGEVTDLGTLTLPPALFED
jgi:hypothetical protein